jgi:5S rRNA maturation endonuclease (ribonuclease M5)
MSVDLLDLRLIVDSEQRNDNAPINIPCPNQIHARAGREDLAASLSVYQYNLHCHGCGYHTTRTKVWETAALLLGLWDGLDQSLSYAAHVKAKALSAGFTRGTSAPTCKPKPIPPLSPGRAIGMYKYLTNHRMDLVEYEFINKRGITLEQIHEARIGYDGESFSIPIYDKEGQLLTIRYRRNDQKSSGSDEGYKEAPKYRGTYGRNHPYVYPQDRLERYFNGLAKSSRAIVAIVEGELDTLPLWECGIAAVTVTNGAGQCSLAVDYIRDRAAATGCDVTIVIATDQDRPGHMASDKIVLAAERVGLTCKYAQWPRHLKDMCELSEYCQRLGIDDLRLLLDIVDSESEIPQEETDDRIDNGTENGRTANDDRCGAADVRGGKTADPHDHRPKHIPRKGRTPRYGVRTGSNRARSRRSDLVGCT